jgi:integrase/recombinase XerC
MRTRNFSKATVSGYRQTLTQYVVYLHDNELTLTTASHKDIEAWLESLALGPRAVNGYISRLSVLYAWLIREELATSNPTVRVDRPKVGRYLPRPADMDGVRRALLEAEPREAAMIACGVFAGMRRAEIANLRVEDLLLRRDPPSVLIHGKGDRDRLLPLHDALLLALRRHGLPAAGYVFLGSAGRRLSPNRVGELMTGALSIDEHVTPHQLRHLAGTTWYAMSHDIRLVQELLGHASPSTTAIYTAFSNEEARRVVTGLAMTPEAQIA